MRPLIRRWLPCILAGALTLVLFRFVLLIGIVPSASMEPLIPQGSFILADRTAYWREAPRVGDVVVFRHMGSLLVKRVAATCGQSVIHAGEPLAVPDGYLYVLGDNAASSIDSADWNDPFIAADGVAGKLIH